MIPPVKDYLNSCKTSFACGLSPDISHSSSNAEATTISKGNKLSFVALSDISSSWRCMAPSIENNKSLILDVNWKPSRTETDDFLCTLLSECIAVVTNL